MITSSVIVAVAAEATLALSLQSVACGATRNEKMKDLKLKSVSQKVSQEMQVWPMQKYLQMQFS